MKKLIVFLMPVYLLLSSWAPIALAGDGHTGHRIVMPAFEKLIYLLMVLDTLIHTI